MDVYTEKIRAIALSVSNKSISAIKSLLKEVRETFRDPAELRHVMARIYNELTPKQRVKLVNHFGATVQIPNNPVTPVAVPPAIPTQTAVQTTITQGGQPQVITPNYQQFASISQAATNLAFQASQAAAMGQGAFGYRYSRGPRHGNYFYNDYIPA